MANLDAMQFCVQSTDAEVNPLSEVFAAAYALPVAEARAWLDRAGVENVRMLVAGGEPAAGLIVVPMGQWFGGRSVPMTGIQGVAVAPHHRGRGTALRLMVETLRELQQNGVALSTLYPATQRLYRRAGYEQAGSRFEARLALKDIQLNERSFDIRPIGPADEETVRDLYRRRAARSCGLIDRNDYLWRRVRETRDGKALGFRLSRNGTPGGYVYYVEKTLPNGHYDLLISDWSADGAMDDAANGADFSCAEVVRGLLTLLADHRSIGSDAVWYTGPTDPMQFAMAEQHYRLKLHFHWMLRIVTLPAALSARGYPSGIAGELHVDVRDEILPENQGRWTLAVREGRGVGSPGGGGRLRTDIGALAALYSGFMSASQLAALGRIEADASSIARADALFAGPAPGMADMF